MESSHQDQRSEAWTKQSRNANIRSASPAVPSAASRGVVKPAL